MASRSLPRDPVPDASLALLRDGYCFVSNRCERFGTDGFRTRLMLKPVICLRGAEAARLFYGGETFTRLKAMPKRVLRLLQGPGSVQQLEGAAHRHRKRMFLDLVGPDGFAPLLRSLEGEWHAAVPRWETQGKIEFLAEMRLVLTKAVCAWAGVGLQPHSPGAPKPEQAAKWLGEMIENVATFGPEHWQARRDRRTAERWIARLVETERAGRAADPEQSTPLQTVAAYRGPDGRKLDSRLAAIEIINLLRPTVAIARFAVFAALALHQHPAWADRLRRTPEDARLFAQEVRRFYPFFPLIGGRARRDLNFRGTRIPAGTWVLLDIYGTDRDPDLWEAADVFWPDRFATWQDDSFSLIPQGGGEHQLDHRCPGEWITIAAIEFVVRQLSAAVAYEVPPQDLSIRRDRMPARPASGMLLRDVRARTLRLGQSNESPLSSR